MAIPIKKIPLSHIEDIPTGDYIPLTGTEAGKPVTGAIEMLAALIIKSYDVNNVVEVKDDGGAGLIEIKDTSTGVGVYLSPSAGIYSDIDFTVVEIHPLAFVQKKICRRNQLLLHR